MRAAIYARYSSDQQREASIDDQTRICRRLIDDHDWTAVKVYADQGLSGSSHLRPGYQNMMMDARNGLFDILVAESIDRLSRDQEHIAALHKQLCYLGVPIVTVAEGEISELHIGLKGTMSALFLKDLAQKTHRGLEGRIREGKSAGGISYGYRVARQPLPDGTFTTGERVIDEQQAGIVRRIFHDYATGISPRTIAATLNREQIPGPAGTAWGASTIFGNWRRGTGILNNELYIGRMVWNRQHFIKDPQTGKRQARPNPVSQWIVQEVPDLRIIDEEQWNAVKERQGATRRIMETNSDGPRPERARRTRYLLSGLLTCGCCGGAYTLVGGKHYGCASARNKGTCDNRRMIRRDLVEERVLGGLRDRLLHPDIIAAFVEEYQQQYNKAMQADLATRHLREAELTKIEQSIAQIVDAIADGMYHPSMKEKMATLEMRRTAIAQELEQLDDEQPLRLHPGLSNIYRKKVAALTEALNADEMTRFEAVELLRGLISTIRLIPDESGELQIELVGELGAIMLLADEGPDNKKPRCVGNGVYSTTLVAGAG
ncbi:recombinase family protein, partial [Brucella ciceri]|uniref:recombinase family protein n=1 Tax=Brucella ciceri TaxID=391287 RepID=UPI001F1316AF